MISFDAETVDYENVVTNRVMDILKMIFTGRSMKTKCSKEL